MSLPEGIQCIITVTVFLSLSTTLFAATLQDKAAVASSDQVSRQALSKLILKISLTREIGQGLEMRVQMKSSVPLQSFKMKSTIIKNV